MSAVDLPAAYESLNPAQRRWVRERYLVLQGGLCWYCKNSILEKSPHDVIGTPINLWRFPDGFLNWPVHLHHDHNTGLTVGAVHAYCNAVSFERDEAPIGNHHQRPDGQIWCERAQRWCFPVAAGGGSGYGRGAVKCSACGVAMQ